MRSTDRARVLREAIAAYGVTTEQLHDIVLHGADFRRLAGEQINPEVQCILQLLSDLFVVPEYEQIKSPRSAAAILMPRLTHLEQEHMVVVMLNAKSHIISTQTVYIGSVNSATVRVAELFKFAIRSNAVSIILVHNHPSGVDASPSLEDIRLTTSVYNLGEELGITLIDHIIIAGAQWYSIREKCWAAVQKMNV